jgi:2-polyprenyl-3-methyl-5-hydroxy-6-metoxy-1,4-benzoquinol methylase
MTEYTYQLSDAELARYRAMAGHALAREATSWTAAGIVPGARVVDLGCGPGTFLADLAARVGSTGRVTGVDDSEEAVRAASALLNTLAWPGKWISCERGSRTPACRRAALMWRSCATCLSTTGQS